MNKKRITAAVSAIAVLIGSVPAMARFEPNDGSDGFSMGYYEEDWKTEDRAKTEALYANRPKVERQMENLSRGLTAVKGEGGTLVSWRFLGTDSKALYYNLYRNGERINNAPMGVTNFFDENAPSGAEYTLAEVVNGAENGNKVTAKAWDKEYITIPVTEREGYIIDDGAVGDLDGDGEYEYIIRRTPIGYFDMLQAEGGIKDTRDKYILIEAYQPDGTHMWTLDLGKNEVNEIDVNFLVYDMDGDGKAEVVMRTYDGMKDGQGNIIGVAGADYTYSLQKMKDRQYLAEGNEYLSVFDGVTGAETMRTELLPKRDPLSDWSYRYTDTSRLTKRASHYLFGLAYLDGVTPSVVMVRGAWDNVRAAAWHVSDGKLVVDWQCLTENKEDVNNIWGAWNHNMTVADIDYDGKDEVLSGPAAIDHDGSELYAVKGTDNDGKEQKFLHGDAFDVAYLDPDYNGYLVWACHETPKVLGNIELHDARTGQVKVGYSKNKDTGRSRAGDIDPNYRGHEMWGSTGTIPMNISGEYIADNFNQFKYRLPDGSFEKDAGTGADAVGTLPMNFKVYWDGDLLSEFLDGTRVSKWNWNDKCVDVIFDAPNCVSNGGTKAVPVMSADLFGDWREEIVWKSKDEKSLVIYSTTIPTSYKIPTLMHDYYYRSSIAVQNNHYNQPPNISYYLGAETTDVPMFEGYVAKDGARVTNPDLSGAHGAYKISNGKTAASSLELVIDCPNAFADGEMVKVDANDDKVVPFIATGDRTLVPVRFISESFGMDVGYDDTTRKVTLSGGGYDIEMTLDSAEYTVNGEKKTLDVTAKSYNGRTMIPLRAMAEAIGKKVHWDNGYIYIGDTELADKSGIGARVEILKSGKAPEPTPTPEPAATPEPTPTPDPLESMTYTEYTDKKGTVWKTYYDEDFSEYSEGDAAGWAGTKPAPLGKIGVTKDGAMGISGSDKGNRNAIYRLEGAMKGKALIELDWKTGAVTGGSSYGELRFADSSNKVFLAFKTRENTPMEYSWGGAISNGALETGEWKVLSPSFTKDAVYHITIEADFETKKAQFTVKLGGLEEKGSVTFDNAEDFGAVEVLAVRQEKNFNWSTEIDNIKISMQ